MIFWIGLPLYLIVGFPVARWVMSQPWADRDDLNPFVIIINHFGWPIIGTITLFLVLPRRKNGGIGDKIKSLYGLDKPPRSL